MSWNFYAVEGKKMRVELGLHNNATESCGLNLIDLAPGQVYDQCNILLFIALLRIGMLFNFLH